MGGRVETSDNEQLNNQAKIMRKRAKKRPLFSKTAPDSIYYVNFDGLSQSLPNNSNNLPELPTSETPQLCSPGPSPASSSPPMDNDRISVISNAPVLDIPGDDEFPQRYQFELQRLHQRVTQLECTVRDKDERIVRALAMLNDELQFWRTYLLDKVGDTYGGIQRRVTRLESTTAYLIDKQSHVWPTLQIPERWQKPAAVTKKGKR